MNSTFHFARRSTDHLRATVAAVLLLAAGGCLAHHHSQAGGALLDDKVTTQRVEAALNASNGRDFQHVRVNTINGVVTLSGVVKDEATRARATEAAQTVQRVKQLDNELMVRR